MKKIFSQTACPKDVCRQRVARTAQKAMMTLMSLILFLLSFSSVAAQDITVSVSPVQRILPPQVLLYVSDPGKYFNITLINNSQITQNVYLGLQLEQTFPSGGLSITTPTNRLPKTAIVVPKGAAYQLTMVDMKNLFNHIPKNEVQTTPGLFDNFTNGSFGMLPEGQYQMHVTAYKWDPMLAKPQALSNPQTGVCTFTVCYKAQAPEFITPISTGVQLVDLSIAKLSRSNPQFTWKQPLVACNPSGQQFTYELRICEVLPNQQPDDALRNATVYQQKNLLTPLAIIPKSSLDRMTADKTYIAQVTATPSNVGANMIGYVMIENSGKSPFRLFKVVDDQIKEEKADQEDKKDDKKEDKKDDKKEDKKEAEEDDDDVAYISSDDSGSGKDSLYNFRLPRIESPSFFDDTARKLFVGDDIGVTWRKAWFLGGEGQEQDKLQFEYTVQLFKGEGGKKEETLKSDPILTFKTKELKDTIRWEKIKDKVSSGDYFVLRILPECKNEKSISWDDEDCNVIDFAIVDRLYKSYFQCSSTTNVTNQECTKKKDSELKGKTVAIGEYNLTLDEISRVKGQDYFKGKGHVEWRPLDIKVMVAVKFDKLYINTDDEVYGGVAESYQDESEKKLSNSEVVDKLFSEWGIDNLIGDTQIPYAKDIQQKTTGEIKNIAQKLDVSKYYSYIKKGQSVFDQFLKGEISDLHLPLQLPKSINKTPVDIQIVSMKFGHNYATMDVLGEFTLPSSNYLKNDILLIGAPRLCISPNRVLPESGTLALLGDFTIVDPESTFEFTFKAPKDLLEPKNGCFISWHADALELFDVDVDMKIPGLVKVDAKGNRTNEEPILNLHASIGSWDDWFAEAKMDNFEAKDLKDWTFMVGEHIVYDHSKHRNAPGMGSLPSGYDKVKAGFSSAAASSVEWQGLYIKHMGVVFPKMLSISDSKKCFEGRLKIDAEDMFFDGSGASFKFGLNNVFDFNTAKVGGWGISMDEVKIDVLQSTFRSAYFNGKIQTPLEGKIGYRCDIYAQGKDAKGMSDPNRSACIFKTQQLDGLKFDFWLGEMSFNKDQTYFLVEHETFKNKDSETRVELCMGGDISITVGRAKLRSMGKVGAFVDSKIPGIHVSSMRIANCPRWKSNYTQNQYEAPKDKGKNDLNEFFGWKTENNIATNKFYFSLGRWSLASAKKSLGCFDFNLKDFGFNYSNKQATLSITGGVSIMNGQLSADCGLDIVADVDLDKYSFKFNTVKFKKAAFDSSFGGVTLKGDLEATTGDDDGYKGNVEIALPGGFLALKASGGYFKRNTNSEKFTWGYFVATAQSSVGLRFDPIVITKLTGGFYFNCKAPNVIGNTPTSSDAKEGVIGGVLGVGLATSGGDNLLSADMTLQVCYDSGRKKLSSIIMDGKLDAFKASPTDKGLVNAECQLAYVNDTEKYIELNITASGGASLDNTMKEKLKALTGADVKLPKDVKQGLSDLTKDETDNKTTEADKNKSGGNLKASCGFEVSLNFKVTLASGAGKKAKWHVYIGEPQYEKRCKLTLIDFQLGKKSDYFAAWAYLAATMYFCIGNELPNNGMLPDPPEQVMSFLNGTDVNGNKQAKGAEATSAKNNTLNQIKNLIAAGKVSGGVMLGACAEGDFGVNAGIVYASGAFCFGFDLVLEKFGSDAKCQGGKSMGYKGWYAMGQAYAMLKGDLGVRVKLWFIDKKVSLISVGLGAMLQAGLPNPTWVYGKVRARCSLLGGLFKFNHSIEFKAGDVCVPDYGNPLDELRMFASASPGYENDSKKGWDSSNKVSVFAEPKFVTNYVINKEIRLVDENIAHSQSDKGVPESEARANAERSYRFQLNDVKLVNKTEGETKWCETSSYNDTDFRVYAGSLKPNCKYSMTLSGYAQEWNKKTAKWDLPEIDGKRKEKKDETTYYFMTGPLEPTLDNDIGVAVPSTYAQGAVRYEDAVWPTISLKHNRPDLSNSSKYKIVWEVWKGDRHLYTCDNSVWTSNDKYEIWAPYYNFKHIMKAGKSTDGGWFVRLVRLDNSVYNMTKISKAKTKTNTSTKQTTGTHSSKVKSATGQPSYNASSNVSHRMNKFFAEQEKEEQTNKSSIEEKSQEMTKEGAKQDGRLVLYTMSYGWNIVNSEFASEVGVSREYNDGMFSNWAVHGIEFDDYPGKGGNYYKDESSTYLGRLKQNNKGYFQNWSAKLTNVYTLLTFYSKYISMGGKKVKPYMFYDYEVNSFPSMSFTFPAGNLRANRNVDGLLSVTKTSSLFESEFWKYTPLPRRDGSFVNGINNYYVTGNNAASYNGVVKDFVVNGYHHSNRTSPYDKSASMLDNRAWRATVGGQLLSDMIMMDHFTHDLSDATNEVYNQILSIFTTVYNMKAKKDKYYAEEFSRRIKIYHNSLSNSNVRNSSKYTYKVTGGDYDIYEGSYSFPYRQIFLNLSLSEILGSFWGWKWGGDPVKDYSSSNHKHRYEHEVECWYTMMKDVYGAGYFKDKIKSISFVKYIPDAYNMKTGKYDVYRTLHRNDKPWRIDNPFKNVTITRSSK